MDEEEIPICYVKAAVYYFNLEQTSWEPVDNGISAIYVYQSPIENTYRVVGICQETSRVVINSTIIKETDYQQSSQLFHNWGDSVNLYGLNFASLPEANTFEETMRVITQVLNYDEEESIKDISSNNKVSTGEDNEETKKAEAKQIDEKLEKEKQMKEKQEKDAEMKRLEEEKAKKHKEEKEAKEAEMKRLEEQRLAKEAEKKRQEEEKRKQEILNQESSKEHAAEGSDEEDPYAGSSQEDSSEGEYPMLPALPVPPAKKASPPPAKKTSPPPAKQISLPPIPRAIPVVSHQKLVNQDLFILKEQLLSKFREELESVSGEVISALKESLKHH